MPSISSLALALLSIGAAVAVPLERRAISDALLTDLTRFSQYAAAAYCPGNNNSPNTKLSCAPANNCPLVESAETRTLFEFENSLITDVTGFVATDSTNRLVVVSFRGSNSVRNWITNVNFDLESTDICAGCEAHDGFWTSWREARAGVLAAIKTAANSNPGFKLVVTGHSLGGAIATLAVGQLRKDGYPAALYTYGAPRVGPAAISDFISNQAGGTFRVTHVDDPVPRLPPRFAGYAHTTPEFYVSSGNGVPVNTGDVVQLNERDSEDGATGDGGLSIPAHLWYFGDMSACSDGDFEWKA